VADAICGHRYGRLLGAVGRWPMRSAAIATGVCAALMGIAAAEGAEAGDRDPS
jgi:hypothetical protein